MAIRVLLADDQAMVRAGFAMILEAPPEELARAVRVVAAGDSLLAPEVTRRLIEAFSEQPARPPAPPPELEELTEREYEVLILVAGGRSNAEIAEQLVLSRGTVKTHVSRILMKLQLRDRIQAVVFAYEAGLITAGQTDPPT